MEVLQKVFSRTLWLAQSSVLLGMLLISFSAHADPPNAILSDADKTMIAQIEAQSDLQFTGKSQKTPNGLVAYFLPNAATMRRLQRRGTTPEEMSPETAAPARVDLLLARIQENGALRLSWWHRAARLQGGLFYEIDIRRKISQLRKMIGLEVTFDEPTGEIVLRDPEKRISARIHGAQIDVLIDAVTDRGTPEIILPATGLADLNDLRYTRDAKNWGARVGKILGVAETTWWAKPGFFTQLSSTQSPFKVVVPHHMRSIENDEKTFEWLAKPEVQEMIFDDQPRRVEWLKKKGYVVQEMSIQDGALFYYVIHHTLVKSTDPYATVRFQVDPDFRTFVKDVSRINARPDWDLEIDPEVTRKREERFLRKGPSCEALFLPSQT